MLFYKPFRKGSPTLAQLKEIRELRTAGWSISKIAKKLGFWPGTVHRHVRDLPIPDGVQSQPIYSFTDKDKAKAGRMRRAGFTWVEIGEELGCGRTEARRLLFGDERDRSHELRTPINEILGAVQRVTGVSRREVRETRRIGATTGSPAIRARQIVFWIGVRRAGLSLSSAGRSLGFDHKTVAHAVGLVDAVANGLHLTDCMGARRVARLLWEAEWPKASA